MIHAIQNVGRIQVTFMAVKSLSWRWSRMEQILQENSFFAPSQGANPGVEHELGEARYQDNGGDLKWIVAADGKYILTVDLNEMKIYLEPTE